MYNKKKIEFKIKYKNNFRKKKYFRYIIKNNAFFKNRNYTNLINYNYKLWL